MDDKEFEKMKRKIIEDGETPITLKNFSNKLLKFLEEIEQRNYEGFKECLDSALTEHNNTLNLIYGLVIGVFSAVFMQSIFELLKIIIKEEYLFFIFSFLAMISFFILVIISSMLFKTMRQMRNYTKKCEKNMKDSLRRKKDIKEESKKRTRIFNS